MMDAAVRIDGRYHGFPGIAIGGFAGGLLADRIGPAAEVTFRRPIPTGAPLELSATGDGVEFRVNGTVLAGATPADLDVDVPAPVSMADAERATQAYPGHRTHPYPSCFTCGPDRAAGDGLRVFPSTVEERSGPQGGSPLVAAAWTPHPDHAGPDGTLPPAIVWSAVDCSSIWPVILATPPRSDEQVVTGRLAVRLDEPIRAGEPHVVTAWPVARRDGRWLAEAAVLDATGSTKAVARHTLVAAEWGVPLGVASWPAHGSAP